MAKSLKECYDLLGLPINASEEEVRKAYKLKARECHPDKNPDDPRATEKFQALNEGYERIVSGSTKESDNVEYFSGFDSYFHFIIFREMMRRRMREEMMARMFGRIFDDDSDFEEDGFPFAGNGSFGGPFFHRPRSHQSFARSNNFRFQDQEDSWYGRQSDEHESSAKPSKKEKHRKRNPRKESNPGPSGDTHGQERCRYSGRRHFSRQETTSDHDESINSKSTQGDFTAKREKETNGKEQDKQREFSKSKPGKNKNKRQMTAAEWQKGRKKNHKKKQTMKFSKTHPSNSKVRGEETDWNIESETNFAEDQTFPQETPGNSMKKERTGSNTGEDTEPGTHTNTGPGTGPHIGADKEPDAGPDTGADTGPHTGADTGADTGPHTGADTGPDTGADTGADTGRHTGPDTGADTGPHTGADKEPDADPDTGADTGPHTGPGTGENTGPHTGPHTGPGTGAETGPHTGPGTGADTGPHTGPGAGENKGPHTGPGTGENTGPHTGPGTGADTGPHTGPGTGADTGPGTGRDTGPHTGPGTGENTGPHTGPHTHTGPGTGPDTGPHTGPGTGADTGPHTGPGTGADTGPHTGPGTGADTGPHTGPGTGADTGPPGTETGEEQLQKGFEIHCLYDCAEKQHNNYKAEQEASQVNTKQIHEDYRNSIDKGLLLNCTSETMDFKTPSEPLVKHSKPEKSGDVTTFRTTSNKASTPISDDSRVQMNDKENVKRLFVKNTKMRKHGVTVNSKAERRKDMKQATPLSKKNSHEKQQKVNCFVSDEINPPDNNQTLRSQADGPEVGPQKKKTGLQQGEMSRTNDINKSSNVSGNETFKEKYDGKAKHQTDGYLKEALGQEEGRRKGNTSDVRKIPEKKQELKENQPKESLYNKGYEILKTPLYKETTKSDRMTSSCGFSDETQTKLGLEEAEPSIVYRKAPLVDQVARRRSSKTEKRQERRQRRVDELLSANSWTHPTYSSTAQGRNGHAGPRD